MTFQNLIIVPRAIRAEEEVDPKPPDPPEGPGPPPFDHLWNPSSDPTFNAGSTGTDPRNVQPGEVIYIVAGVHTGQSFSMENLAGDPGNRIIIINDPDAIEPVIFEHTGDAFEFFRWKDCQEFTFSGAGKYLGAPGGQLGVEIIDGVWTEGRTQAGIIFRDIDNSTAKPTGYLKTAGSTQKFVVSGFELDGKGNIGAGRSGIGFMAHDRFNYQKDDQFDLLFRDDMIIEKYYIHDTHHEAIYTGVNWANKGPLPTTDGSSLDADPRNCHHRFGIADDCGWGGGQIKGAWDDTLGRSSIHHCAAYRCGGQANAEGDPGGHNNGFQMTGSNGDIYNCWSEDSGGPGITATITKMDIGTGPDYSAAQILAKSVINARIFNCVVNRNGRNANIPASNQRLSPGISVAHTSDTVHPHTGFPIIDSHVEVFQNTVIDGDQDSIRAANAGAFLTARDNICAGDGNGGPGSIGNNGEAAPNVEINNLVNTIAAIGFVDPDNDDYHLLTSSPAHEGGSVNGFPVDDIVGEFRPQGVVAEQGAYEFIEVTPRNILGENIFAFGSVKSNNSPDGDGIVRDAGFILGGKKWGAAITITNINKAVVPAIATFTGSMPDPGIAVGSAYMDAPGFTLAEITSGMTELSKRLIRAKNVSGNTFECWQDGDDNGVNSAQDVLGNTPVDATAYGNWSGSVQAQAYKKIDNDEQSVWFALGSDDYPNCRVVTSITPPDTVEGSASEVFPLEGNNFWSNQVNYWIDHTRDADRRTDGVWQPTNKPRNQILMQNSNQRVPDNETIWHSLSIFLPTNFDVTSVTKSNGDQSETQLMDWAEEALGGQGGLFALHVQHGEIGLPGGEMGWVLDAALNGFDDSATENILLANVEDDIGLWTTFVWKCFPAVSPNGILQVWKSTGPYLGGANPLDRAMTQVYSRTGDSVGFRSVTGFWGHVIKQYKHGWHHGSTSPTDRGLSFEQWIGFDCDRWGTEESHGTDFSDVHPFRRTEP